MARVNISAAPYFDDTDMSKQYYQLLARPGHVAQAREFTSMQTTLREIIKSIGDSILNNGDVIEGCQVIITGTSVLVTSGKVYLDGIVMNVTESTVTITGIGTETIGVKLMEEIIDENSDSTLRDPAQGYDNYNQPGCTRLRRYISVVANDPDSATIATLVDGSIIIESVTPTYDTLTQLLARRTYDESGSYIVEGLKSRTEEKDTLEYNLVVESGKAYVLGYELKMPAARRISVNRSTTYNIVNSNYNQFRTLVSTYLLDSNPHVKSIISVNGQVSKTVNQSISTNLDSVLLPDSDVVQIVSVTQGGTSYEVGSTSSDGDCYLTRSGNTYILKWNGTSNFPAAGSTYTVVYHYNKFFVQDTDYELSLINGSHYLSWIDGGSTPLNNTLFTVIYEQYLARKDIVYIDRYGDIRVIEGIPAEYGLEVLPEAPLNTLVLANIYNPPNGTVFPTSSSYAIEVTNVGLTRFTMNDIQNILNRVKTMEYDQAVLSLNNEAKNVETVSDKKGLFTDPIIDMSRVDFYYNIDSNTGNIIDVSKPLQDIAFDLASNICYLPIESNVYEPVYDDINSTTNKYNRLISLNTTGERVVLEQSNATKVFLVNPYSMYPQIPKVSVEPAIDNWIDTTTITIPRTINQEELIRTSTRNLEVSTVSNPQAMWGNTNSFITNVSTSQSIVQTSIGVRTNAYTTDRVTDTSITYIRSRTLTVEGREFPANIDNISCYFDSQRVVLTPATGTLSGTELGTVKADANGYVKATFTIPSGVLTGTREVLLKSSTVIDNVITEGFTLYIATGISRRIEKTVTTVNTVLLERVITNTTTNTWTVEQINTDPVGQTFMLDQMTLLKGIDLYFENKPDSNTSIDCEIREVVNGTISSTVYSRRTLPATSVNISSDASVATRFNFNDPVLIEENKFYAFVVRSVSDDYRIWVSELGGTDVNTGNIILKNSYLAGLMFSSSNNSTWTSHQMVDIKFKLVSDVYSLNSNILFNNISVTDAARLYLNADSATPVGTSIDWSYSLNNGTNFIPITPYNNNLLNGIYSNILLKAQLSRTNTSTLSPLIALDTIEMITSCYDTEGYYISKNVTGLDSYTTIKVIVDLYEPAGTSISVKVSRDNGVNIVNMTRGTSTLQNYGWNEVVFTKTVSSSTQFRVFLNCTSLNKFTTPAFRRLRCILS